MEYMFWRITIKLILWIILTSGASTSGRILSEKKQYFAILVISKHKRIYESFLCSLKQSLLVSKGFIGLGNSMFPDNENPEYHPVLERHLPTPHQASEMILSLVLEGVSWMYREFTSNGFCGMENRIWAAVRSVLYCSSFARPNRNRTEPEKTRTEPKKPNRLRTLLRISETDKTRKNWRKKKRKSECRTRIEPKPKKPESNRKNPNRLRTLALFQWKPCLIILIIVAIK